MWYIWFSKYGKFSTADSLKKQQFLGVKCGLKNAAAAYMYCTGIITASATYFIPSRDIGVAVVQAGR